MGKIKIEDFKPVKMQDIIKRLIKATISIKCIILILDKMRTDGSKNLSFNIY